MDFPKTRISFLTLKPIHINGSKIAELTKYLFENVNHDTFLISMISRFSEHWTPCLFVAKRINIL